MMEDAIPTTELSKKIEAINKDAVHHICSGQVVLDLATAIKELVENSLDSDATLIEVKLTDHGRTCVTVSDNGSGVLEEDFEGLGLKHHTSKLRDFSDLADVGTFGFRGEALSSLCSLSELSIVTRHKSKNHAYKLEFDANGYLKSKEACARDRGTTVHVRNLFKSLPVRAKEFQRNYKKEFAKAIQVLYGYCLVSKNIRITCANSVSGKQSSQVLGTLGAPKVLDNVLAVFGKKSLDGLLTVDRISPDETVLQEYGLTADKVENTESDVSWECYVSSCAHSMGRSAPDRQFFYINGRPCDPTKISRLVNHVYHKYNAKQYPFVFLDLSMKRDCADVNVTPDKRTIFLIQESIILASLKFSLMKTWERTLGSLTTAKLDESNFSFKRIASSVAEGDPPAKKQQLDVAEENINGRDEDNGGSLEEPEATMKKRNLPKLGNSTKSVVATMEINLESVKQALRDRNARREANCENLGMKVKFRTKIEPNLCKDAEQELKRELTKDSFEKMEIVGQFNLGFIVARLDEDLFIVDQHASDEKYRFEKLQSETKLKTQKLIAPRKLNLAALNETILIENQKTFVDNGFTLKINDQEPPGHRVEVTGIPVSGNWQFGQEDIEELVFLLREGGSDDSIDCGDGIPRPSRVRQMLASRACRGAVMVGKALNEVEMRRLLFQMGQIKNPWSCPHGRPTIRHLLCLSLLSLS